MDIEVKNTNVVYITMGEWTYYIDNSTGEQIMDKWLTDKPFKDQKDQA